MGHTVKLEFLWVLWKVNQIKKKKRHHIVWNEPCPNLTEWGRRVYKAICSKFLIFTSRIKQWYPIITAEHNLSSEWHLSQSQRGFLQLSKTCNLPTSLPLSVGAPLNRQLPLTVKGLTDTSAMTTWASGLTTRGQALRELSLKFVGYTDIEKIPAQETQWQDQQKRKTAPDVPSSQPVKDWSTSQFDTKILTKHVTKHNPYIIPVHKS